MNKLKIEHRYGILSGILLSVWVLIEYALGFHTTYVEIGSYSGYFSIIIPLSVIFVALHEQQIQSNSLLSWKDGINIGFRISFYSAVILTIFFYYYNTSINPGWIDAMIEWQRKKMIIGGATDDEIGRFMEENRRMNNSLSEAIMGFISTTGLGVFITLIEIPIVKKFQLLKIKNK